MPSMSAAARRGALAYCAMSSPRGAGQGESSRSSQACRALRASRAVQVRTPVPRASTSTVPTASAREVNGPIACRLRGRAHDREPGERLVGERDPPPPAGELGPAVVRRGVRGQQPEFAYPGLQFVRAFDVVDPGGQRHHLLHPGARVRPGEVLADPAAQIHRGADVEHLVAGTAEQVHAGPDGTPVGQMPLAPLRGGRVGEIGAQLGVGAHALVAHPLDEPVQHVDGGAGIVERPVGGRGGGAEQLARAPRASRWAPRRGSAPGAPASPCTAPAGAARAGRVAGRRPAGIRCRIRRCARRAPRPGRTPGTPAARCRSGVRRRPSPR